MNEQPGLFAGLGCRVTSGEDCNVVTLPIHQITNEVWKEIINNNLDPEAPFLVYCNEPPTDNNINLKVICTK